MEDDAVEEEYLKPLSVLLGGMDNDELEQFVRSVSLNILGSESKKRAKRYTNYS